MPGDYLTPIDANENTVSDSCITPTQKCFSYIINCQWDDDEVRVVLDQHT